MNIEFTQETEKRIARYTFGTTLGIAAVVTVTHFVGVWPLLGATLAAGTSACLYARGVRRFREWRGIR